MNLSIIVPVGRPETAAKTVRSLLQQRCLPEDVQIILAGAQIRALEEQFRGSRIEYVHLSQRLNPAATRIAGAARARGEWYLFVDDDIELDAGFMEKLLAFIRDAADTGAVGARLPGRENSYFSRVTDFANFWSQQTLCSGERDWLYSAVLAVPGKVYCEAGGFNPELAIGEDVELTGRIKKAGHAVVYRAELVGFHNHGRTTFCQALSYFRHNGGLALYELRNSPELRPWNAGKIIHTWLGSLTNTMRVNGRDSVSFYWYLPGIICMYLVYSFSLEYHYQKYMFAFIKENNGRDILAGRNIRSPLFRRYLAERSRARKSRALFLLAAAVARENLTGMFMAVVLILLVTAGLCASG